MKNDIIKNYRKTKKKPVDYKIDSIYKSDTCSTVPKELIGKVSFVYVKLYFPFVGEGKLGQTLNTVFFIENKYPYKISGIEDFY